MAAVIPFRILTCFCCMLTFLHSLLHCSSLSQDGVILLKMKKADWKDTRNALSDWNELHENPCAWQGISCDAFNTVTAIDLTGSSISGNLTSAICALPNLTSLTLQDNAFTGPFPHALLHCKRLHKIDLSTNYFAGKLPTRISQLSELRELNLANNAFTGPIPLAFTGPILKSLTLDNNPLRPAVLPIEIGNLKQLQQLSMQNCSLVGGVPSFLGNLTRLEVLDLSQNHLSGTIPATLMALENLNILYLFANNLSGRIPANIGQLKSLSGLDLSENQLHGTIPNGVSNLTKLDTLYLFSNRFNGEIPAELGSFRYLLYLRLSGNKLNGWLPPTLGTFSPLYFVDVVGNDLEGPLPKNLCRGGELTYFDATSNKFNGSLPSSFGDCNSLVLLHIDNNRLSGKIPPGLWGSSNLEQLFLSNNEFEGQISAAIGEAKNLTRLELSNNQFEGRIPAKVGQLTKLQVLKASKNRLSGPIPRELGALSWMSTLRLDHNFLSGEIPTEIMSLKKLSQLNLAHNRLSSEIPAPALNDNLNSLDLSNNFLSGGIPPELGHLKLNVFNVCNNDLSGRIPEALDNLAYKKSILGNQKLCGGQNLMLPPCSSPHKLSLRQSLATILVSLLLIVAVLCCTVCLCYFLFFRKPSSWPSWKLTPFHSADVDELYIIDNLKETNVIGSGGARKVYKVILPNGQVVAVKKIQKAGRSSSAEVEVDTLGLIRHNNILKLLCCISSEESDFKLLVYEYMPNGSLFDRLHGGPERGTPLEWPKRFRIALDAAHGLSYLHHSCPAVLHGNVTSSNILLDSNFGAKIAGFGASRVLRMSSSVGSDGYIAPERSAVDEKSDVYSFGVVLLELVSRRKAGSKAKYKKGKDIVGWTRKMCALKKEVLDDCVVDENCKGQMLCVLRVGLMCTQEQPNRRPSIRMVVKRLLACSADSDKRTMDTSTPENLEMVSLSEDASSRGISKVGCSESDEEELNNALDDKFKLAVFLVPIMITLFIFAVPTIFKNHGKDKNVATKIFLVGWIVAFMASIMVVVILGLRRSLSIDKKNLLSFSKAFLFTAVAFFLLTLFTAFYFAIPSEEKMVAISAVIVTTPILCCAFLYFISR